MSTPPFVRFYANDWFTGCAGLKADERGVYVSMCVYIWTTGRRVPLDDAEASRMMNLNFKSYQRIRDRLVVIGKVTRHENGYGNERAEHELAAAAEAAAAKGRAVATPDRGDEGRAPEVAEPRTEAPQNAKANGPVLTDHAIDSTIDHAIDHRIDHAIEGQKIETNQSPFIEPEPITRIDVVGDGARDVSIDRNELAQAMKRITDAAKPVLRDGGMSSGLMGTSSEIAKWLKDGCDIDADILPVIEAAVAKGAVVSSWKFFSQSIVDAKASREAPLPAPVPKGVTTHAADRNRTARYPTKHDRLQSVVARCLERNAGPAARPEWARDLDGDALTIVPGA